MIYNEIYREPRWHKLVDAIVILFIGVICGIVFTQGMKFYDVETTTTTESRYIIESPELKKDGSTGEVIAPQKTLKFEEI